MTQGTLLHDSIRRTRGNAMVAWAILGGIPLATAIPLAIAGVAAGAGVCGLIAAAAGFMFVRAMSVRSHPERDPAVAALLARGLTLEQLSLQVEQERGAAPPPGKTLEVLPSWLFQVYFFNLVLARIDDIAWAYTQVFQTDSSAEITLYVHTISEPAREIRFPSSRQQVDQVLQMLGQRAPWAFLGFDQQRKTAWATQPSRDPLVAHVVAQREQLQQRSAR